MSLRGRLLISFLGASLGTVALFGGVAYTSAHEFNRQQLPALLHDHNQQLIHMLDPAQAPLEQILAMLPHHETPSDTFGVLDGNGEAVSLPIDHSRHGHPRDGTPPIGPEMLAADKGFTTFNGNDYIWVADRIPGTPYTLVNTHRSAASGLSDFLQYIGLPLGIAVLFGIWLSVWGAMIISTLFKKLNDQRVLLEHQAHHDPLTDLPNRDSLTAMIEQTISALADSNAASHDRTLAVCMIDLQHFKEINDSLGHACGDELLRQVAKRLQNVLRDSDKVGRFYGNKFAVMINNAKTNAIDAITERLFSALEPAFEIDGHHLYIRGTLGVALYPQHATDAPALLQQAEAAIFQARDASKTAAIYLLSDNVGGAERLELTNELRNAIRDGQLELYYQPKLDLRSGRIVGTEALARWIHPQRGFIPPDQFIDIAEDSGLIKELTEWVLETTVQQCAQCHAKGMLLKISANLSAINLHDDNLPTLLETLLQRHQLAPQYLVMEITETAMMIDPTHAQLQIEKLDRLGTYISIDDFGTGYSSLGHLRQLPVDEIKIDKSFVMDMIDNDDDASIVRATIGLAHDLGLEVVAEGVENEAILDSLRNMGCDIAQGYHIAKPMPAADFLALLEGGAAHDDRQAAAPG